MRYDTCHETVRFWWNCFGPLFAAEIEKKRSAGLRAQPQWRRQPDGVFMMINGQTHAMAKLWDVRTLQKFASVQALVHNHFSQDRHFHRRAIGKQDRSAALAQWRRLPA